MLRAYATEPPGFKPRIRKAQSPPMAVDWVAVKELRVSYRNGDLKVHNGVSMWYLLSNIHPNLILIDYSQDTCTKNSSSPIIEPYRTL